MFHKLVLKNRSYRRFDESCKLSRNTLEDLVALSRICPSAGNRQSLRFRVSFEKDECDEIFSCLSWAAYLSPEGTPGEGERPSAYIVILHDTTLGACNTVDVGISAQTMLLGACERGYGGCMFGSIKRDKLKHLLGIDDRYEVQLVLALGKPVEQVVITDVKDGDIKYFRDENCVHHVPKRTIGELIV